VAVTKGDVTVSHRNVAADCIVSSDKALFENVASGKTNAMAALLRGAIGVEGDVQLLVLFQRLFPGPPRTRKRRRTSAAARRSS
jgi:putative sterol carrier protein